MQIKKLLGILVLGLLWCNAGFAANFNWKKGAETFDGTSTWHYDKKTIFEVGGHKYFWQLTDYLDDDGTPIRSVITHSMVNCDTYKIRWITYSGYSGQMGKGQIIDDVIIPEFDLENFKWTYYDPNKTSQGKILKKVCNSR